MRLIGSWTGCRMPHSTANSDRPQGVSATVVSAVRIRPDLWKGSEVPGVRRAAMKDPFRAATRLLGDAFDGKVPHADVIPTIVPRFIHLRDESWPASKHSAAKD